MTGRIAIVLPRKEAFARDHFGAIALTVEAYLRHSAYRNVTEVLGVETGMPRDPDVFRAVRPRDRWWRGRNRGFAEGCAAYLAAAPPRHIDVHNRAEVFDLLATRFAGAAVSLWFHNDPQEMRGTRSAGERQRILGLAHRIFCVSNWVRERFLDGISRDSERVIVMPSPIDLDAAPAGDKKNLILYAGRIIPEKGVLPLAEALARVLPAAPGWQAAIIGDAPRRHGGYRDRVAAAVAPLKDRVAMPGFLSHEETMAAFARAAIAVVPSQWDEPFGRTALEAMAAGCAVIASRRGGLPEIIGEAGLSLEVPAAPTLAAAIAKLARDDALRTDLQQKAKARAAEFEARRWAARLDALREGIAPEPGR